jgi:hypothetical protein
MTPFTESKSQRWEALAETSDRRAARMNAFEVVMGF